MKRSQLFSRRKHISYVNFCNTEFRNFAFGQSPNVLTIRVKNLTNQPQPVNLFKAIDQAKVNVSTTGGDYGAVPRSITATPFVVKDFKVIAKNRDQLNEPFVFTYQDMLGETKQQSIIPSTYTSSYQRNPAQIDSLGGTGMIVGINSSIQFTLLPGENLSIIMKLGKVKDQFKNFYKNAVDPMTDFSLNNVFSHGNKIQLRFGG